MWSTCGPIKKLPICGAIKKLEDGEGTEASASPPGSAGTSLPLPGFGCRGGWVGHVEGLLRTHRPAGTPGVCGRGHGGSVDHDLSTAGGHQLISQCALSEGMEGLEFCPPPGAGGGGG